MSKLEGKRCLLTGATGGLGEELSRELESLGCRLFVTGRSAQSLEALSGRLARGVEAACRVPADLAVDSDVERLIACVMERMGGIDVLVNNAGVFPVGPLATLSDGDLDECLRVNLKAAIVLSRAFTPAMAEAGWGRVVNIASSSAYAGFADTAVYCASKHGLLGFSRALDDELRGRGVRVTTISPGSIQTPMGRKVRGQSFETFLSPREIAQVVGTIVCLDGSLVVNELRLSRMVMA